MSGLKLIRSYLGDSSDGSEQSSDEEDFRGFSENTCNETRGVLLCYDQEKRKNFRSFFASLPLDNSGDIVSRADISSKADDGKVSTKQSIDHGCEEKASDFHFIVANEDEKDDPGNDGNNYDDVTSNESLFSMSADNSDGSFFGNLPEKSRSQRKRTKKEARKRDIAKRRRLSHATILEHCGCSKECSNLVSKDDRIDINNSFWSLDAAGQKHFIRERVIRKAVKRRSRNAFSEENLRKRHSYEFHIRAVASDEVPKVCRKFFLNTFGYGEHCGNIIYRMVEDADDDEEARPRSLKRGKYERSTEKYTSVKTHINKYNPCISHYRREHAPNRLYLPSDLSVRKMYKHYKETHETEMKELELKFFEPGHTFMAADSFHAAVEGSMRKDPPITYEDFRTVVANAKSNVEVLDMQPEDFFSNFLNVSQYALNKIKPRPYIDNIRYIAVKKGSLNLHYSESVSGKDLKSCKIFTAKQERLVSDADFDLENQLKRKREPRGIDANRKADLLKVILPLIEEDKKAYWSPGEGGSSDTDANQPSAKVSPAIPGEQGVRFTGALTTRNWLYFIANYSV
ncbi:uncharacterized protein LOC134222135 [Armigeres subalbatus]|uniref:uncharacterized protein LOC134222135 n=1 Tax=Armigeres subalbatus TaxID=124917 RepID=UPI002ED48BF1